MSLNSTIASVRDHLSEAYDALEEKGAELPEDKNLANLASTIETLSGGSSSIKSLKKALDNGTASDKFPVGSEIYDTYAAIELPWTVMEYGTATSSTGTNIEGVYLVRLTPNVSRAINSSSISTYVGATTDTFLNNDYLSNCSDSFRDVVTEIDIPCTNHTGVYRKIWLLSATEILSNQANHVEGRPFQLWKDRTGQTQPFNGDNPGRAIKDQNGQSVKWWTRTPWSSSRSSMCGVYEGGAVAEFNAADVKALVVCCFIAKDN